MTPDNATPPLSSHKFISLSALKHRIPLYYKNIKNSRLLILKGTALGLMIGVAGTIQLLTTPGFLTKNKSEKQIPKQATLVTTELAKTAQIPVYISALGTVTPLNTVTVKTQINGQLQKVLFKEGQAVKEGESLAQIDSRPYEAQLTQFEGQLERDKALLANAKIDLNRYKVLYKQDSISQQTLDTQKALVKQYEGTVKADEGQIQAVKTNLTYCNITSPIMGRVGLRLVDQGNYVQTTDTSGLATLNQTAPITIVFTIPEDNVPAVLSKIQQGEKLEVQAYDRLQKTLLDTGFLMAMDNQIDPTTGTIKIKAAFENTRETLFPNQFVNVKLQVDQLKDAVLVPTSAVQYGAKGNFVYIVEDNQTARLQYVTIGITHKNETVIQEGIKAGEKVVKEGTDKLTNGAPIKVSANPPAASPSPTLEKKQNR